MTGQAIFNSAMALIGEVTSGTYTADTTSYATQAVPILNTLVSELYPLSDTFSPSDGGKRTILTPITSLSDAVGLDDYICTVVLPYGLAAQLQISDNPNLASFHQQRYEELKAALARSRPMEWETIEDLYGLTDYNEFGSW